MASHRLSSLVVVAALASLLPAGAAAQWTNPTPGLPRLPDGKPDLTGVWRGAAPIYRFNIAQDLKPEDIQPWAEALFLQRVRDSRKDSPLAHCQPVSVPFHDFFDLVRIVQNPAMIVMMFESPNSPHRIVFTDGRELPKDTNTKRIGY